MTDLTLSHSHIVNNNKHASGYCALIIQPKHHMISLTHAQSHTFLDPESQTILDPESHAFLDPESHMVLDPESHRVLDPASWPVGLDSPLQHLSMQHISPFCPSCFSPLLGSPGVLSSCSIGGWEGGVPQRTAVTEKTQLVPPRQPPKGQDLFVPHRHTIKPCTPSAQGSQHPTYPITAVTPHPALHCRLGNVFLFCFFISDL